MAIARVRGLHLPALTESALEDGSEARLSEGGVFLPTEFVTTVFVSVVYPTNSSLFFCTALAPPVWRSIDAV